MQENEGKETGENTAGEDQKRDEWEVKISTTHRTTRKQLNKTQEHTEKAKLTKRFK